MRSLRSFSAFLLGNVVYTLGQFGVLTVLARQGTLRDVGSYALALAITAPVFVFSAMKLRQVMVTDYAGAPLGSYYGFRIATSVTALALACLLAAVARLDRGALALVAVVALFKALEAYVDVLYGVLQQQELFARIGRSQVVRGVANVVAFALVFSLTGSLSLAVWSMSAVTVGAIASLALVLGRLHLPVRPTYDVATLRRILRLAAPLGLAASTGALITNMPRYQIQHVLGAEDLAVFAVLSYSLVATGLVAGALADVALPRLARLYVEDRPEEFAAAFRRLAMSALATGLVGVLGAVLVGRPLLQAAFGRAYADDARVLTILMVAALVQYLTLSMGCAISAMRRFTVQTPIAIGGLATVTVSAAVLIPAAGLTGAAYAVVCGELVMVLCYTVVYRREQRRARLRHDVAAGSSRSGDGAGPVA